MYLKTGFITTLVLCDIVRTEISASVEDRARDVIHRFQTEGIKIANNFANKAWAYYTNISDFNSKQMVIDRAFYFSLIDISKCIDLICTCLEYLI